MLPIETKQAMLVGLDNETIVTGAYTHDGGICPMLAAHRRGGRTSRESFAHAWDRYTGANKGRAASEREIRTLRAMLDASLMEPVDLHEFKRPDVVEGWSWSRLFRRWDTYAATIGPLEDGVAPDRSSEETPVLVSDLAAEDGVRPVATV
jgi:plasmid stabilization system protein ParE